MIKVSLKQFKDAITQSVSKNGVIKLKSAVNTLRVISADMEGCLSVSIPAEVYSYRSIIVDKKALSNTLKSIKSEYIDMSVDDSNLVIKTDKLSYKLKLQTSSVGFHLDEMDIDSGIILNSKALIQAIGKVIYALEKSKHDYYEHLKGVGFIFEGGSFYVSGTDGNRLVVCDLKVSNNLNYRVSIPKNPAMHLKKLLKKDDVLFGIIPNDEAGFAVFKSDNFKFVVRLKEFPDALSVIKTNREHLIIDLKLSKEFICDALKAFMIEKDSYPIKLTLRNNTLTLSSEDNSVDIEVDYKGNEYYINFNALYLLEAIDNLDSDEVFIKLPSDTIYPIYIEPVDNCGCVAIVMPIG
jgi:DNA polymerase-3 subunit beta